MPATWRVALRGVMLSGTEMFDVEPSAGVVTRARVLTVDDDASFLELLRDLVRATAHLEVAGEACSGERAIVVAGQLLPELVLMDIRMPGLGGIKAAGIIKAARRSTLIVMISATHPDETPPDACAGFGSLIGEALGLAAGSGFCDELDFGGGLLLLGGEA